MLGHNCYHRRYSDWCRIRHGAHPTKVKLLPMLKCGYGPFKAVNIFTESFSIVIDDETRGRLRSGSAHLSIREWRFVLRRNEASDLFFRRSFWKKHNRFGEYRLELLLSK